MAISSSNSSWLAQAGVQERLIASIFGHSTGSLTARYTHFGFDHKVEAVRRLVTLVDSPHETAKRRSVQLESKSVGA